MDSLRDHPAPNQRHDQATDHSILLSRHRHPDRAFPDRYIVGDVIAGRYEVLAVHKGGMGIVYATFDNKAKLPRALKTIQARFATDPTTLDLFEEEAAVWVRLEKHPFIVRAYSVQRIEGLPYVISEYVRGQPGMGSDSPHGSDTHG